jgi:hypothetical protein
MVRVTWCATYCTFNINQPWSMYFLWFSVTWGWQVSSFSYFFREPHHLFRCFYLNYLGLTKRKWYAFLDVALLYQLVVLMVYPITYSTLEKMKIGPKVWSNWPGSFCPYSDNMHHISFLGHNIDVLCHKSIHLLLIKTPTKKY